MDFTTIEINKNVCIQHDFNDSISFEQNINLNFVPDYMIVRAIQYFATSDPEPDSQNLYTVDSNINNEIIGSFIINRIFPDPVLNLLNGINVPQILYFKLGYEVKGTYTFNIKSPMAGEFSMNGGILIHLDFVKFKAVKPQKIY